MSKAKLFEKLKWTEKEPTYSAFYHKLMVKTDNSRNAYLNHSIIAI
jgi:hypothetical protein